MKSSPNLSQHALKAGMVGMGMIFDETYRPFFERAHAEGIYRRDFGLVDIHLTGAATRTGSRANAIKRKPASVSGLSPTSRDPKR